MLTQTLHKCPCPPPNSAAMVSLVPPFTPRSTCSFSLMELMLAPSQFENHHLQIQEAGLGVSQKNSRLREGNAGRMRKAGMPEQGWSLQRPCSPEEEGRHWQQLHSAVSTGDHARCSWRCSSHTMTCAHHNATQASRSLYTTSSFSLRKLQTDLFQLILSEGQTDWLKEFKKSTNPKFTWSTLPCHGLYVLPFLRSKHQEK